jgi:hypothetical protein
MAKVFDWYKELPGWAKGLTAIAVVGVAAYTGFKIYGGIRTAIRKAQAGKSIKDVATERKEYENNGISASFANSDYQGWASAIEQQFSGCDFSTPLPFLSGRVSLSKSGRVIGDILNTFNNNVDFLKLVEAWGIRTYDDCGIGTGNVENVNLYGAVNSELDSYEVSVLNDLLASKKITYRF